MDIRTRQGLLNALSGKAGKRMDSLLVPLELLSCVSRTEFSDKKAYLRWQKRQVKTTFSNLVVFDRFFHLVFCIYHLLTFLASQLNMLAEGLINHPVVGFGESGRKANDLKSLLQRIEESEVFVLLYVQWFMTWCRHQKSERFPLTAPFGNWIGLYYRFHNMFVDFSFAFFSIYSLFHPQPEKCKEQNV